MVRPGLPRILAEDGAVMAEAVLVFPLLLVAMAALIELGMVMFRVDQAARALEVAARLAAVSDPLVSDFAPISAGLPVAEGGPVPQGAVTVTCGRGAAPCDPVRLARLMQGDDGRCDGAAATGQRGLCDLTASIAAQDLRISYTRSGLGFVGREAPPVVVISLQAQALPFDLPFLATLIGRERLAIPLHPVTVMGEDLMSCPDGC